MFLGGFLVRCCRRDMTAEGCSCPDPFRSPVSQLRIKLHENMGTRTDIWRQRMDVE